LLTKSCLRTKIKINPEVRITSLEPLGVGQITVFGPYLLVNNIGCNLEFSLPSNEALEAKAFFLQTPFRECPDRSSFDLDMHALIYNAPSNCLMALNHDGRIRLFNASDILALALPTDYSAGGDASARRELTPDLELLWKADVEHSLPIGDFLVSTSPLGYGYVEPPQPGLFVSEPINFTIEEQKRRFAPQQRLNCSVLLSELGYLSSIAFEPSSKSLAIASGNKIYLTKVRLSQRAGFSLEEILWQNTVDFHTTFLAYSKGGALLAAGYETGLQEDPHDPSSLVGGGFATLNVSDGQIVNAACFDRNLAWGTSGNCLTLSKDPRFLIGVDRFAGLHRWHIASGLGETLFEENSQAGSVSSGISHLAWMGDTLYCGFNRNSHYLHAYEFPANNG
jgi:hypothetical protein